MNARNRGTCKVLVTATGHHTELGKIAYLLKEVGAKKSHHTGICRNRICRLPKRHSYR